MSALATLTSEVVDAIDPEATAKARWKNKPTAAFSEVRAVLQAMAAGRERCMYCEDNEGTDIEHFWPKSTYPNKAFCWTNYLLACSNCNSNYKRVDFPMTDGRPDLIDPTDDDDNPTNHLRLLPSNRGGLDPDHAMGLTSRRWCAA